MNYLTSINEENGGIALIVELFSQMPAILAVYEINIEFGKAEYILINKEFKTLLGYDENEINTIEELTKMAEVILYKDDKITTDARSMQYFQNYLLTGSNEWIQFKYRMVKKNGEFLFVHCWAKVFEYKGRYFALNVNLDNIEQVREIDFLNSKINNLELKLNNAIEKINYEKLYKVIELREILLKMDEKEIKPFLESNDLFKLLSNNNSRNNLQLLIKSNADIDFNLNHNYSKLVYHFPTLTKREIEICLEIIKMRTSKDISQSLTISQRTVELQRYKIRKKLGLKTNMDLTTFLLSKLNT